MNKNEFKIVKILDEYSVVINAGMNNGVSLGDKFDILESDGNEVFDPDTNELLGELNLVKDTVEVTELYENICVCSNENKISFETTYGSLNTNNFFQPESTDISEREKLNVELSQITGRKRSSNNRIRLRDIARHFINE